MNDNVKINSLEQDKDNTKDRLLLILSREIDSLTSQGQKTGFSKYMLVTTLVAIIIFLFKNYSIYDLTNIYKDEIISGFFIVINLLAIAFFIYISINIFIINLYPVKLLSKVHEYQINFYQKFSTYMLIIVILINTFFILNFWDALQFKLLLCFSFLIPIVLIYGSIKSSLDNKSRLLSNELNLPNFTQSLPSNKKHKRNIAILLIIFQLLYLTILLIFSILNAKVFTFDNYSITIVVIPLTILMLVIRFLWGIQNNNNEIAKFLKNLEYDLIKDNNKLDYIIKKFEEFYFGVTIRDWYNYRINYFNEKKDEFISILTKITKEGISLVNENKNKETLLSFLISSSLFNEGFKKEYITYQLDSMYHTIKMMENDILSLEERYLTSSLYYYLKDIMEFEEKPINEFHDITKKINDIYLQIK